MKERRGIIGINITWSVYIILLFFLNVVRIYAQPVDYYFQLPDSSGMWDIKADFGAVGDGITDDTKAFIEAFRGDSLSYYFGENEGGYRAVYIPPGIYLVNQALVIGDKKKVILGAARDSVIIKLAPNSQGFDDPGNPKIFIDALAKQYQAQNFWIFIKHLTIEIGEGNPGAIGLSFHTNNTGGVYDVEIRSVDPEKAGFCGLQLKAWPGPGIIKHVTINGFDYGVIVTDDQYSMTFEYLTIINSRNTAFENTSNTCSIRKLYVENVPRGVVNKGNQSMMSLIDSEIHGSGEKAVQCTSNGLMIIRDLVTTGFDYALVSDNDTITGPDISEWHSHPKGSPFPARSYSMRLPIAETPELPYENDTNKYIVIGAFSGDFAEAMQNAIDYGYEAIYLCPGWGKPGFASSFPFSKTIIIRNNVKRIMGLGNAIITPNVSGGPAFRIEDGNSDTIIFENIYENYGSSSTFTYEQASRRTLVLQNGSGSYHNIIDSCVVFIENIVGSPIQCTNMKAWIRDLNTESYDHIHVVNDNSNIWALGHKTEKDQTIYETKNGGKTELLGGLFYKNNEHVVHPMLVVIDANATFSYRAKGVQYLFHLEETRNGVTQKYVATRTYDWRMALLSASSGNVPEEPKDLTADGISDNEIELTWTDNSDNEEGFIIWRSADGSLFSIIDTLNADIISYNDAGLLPSKTYYYQVASFASDGNSLNLFTPVVEGTTKSVSMQDQSLTEGIIIFPLPAQEILRLIVNANLSGTSLIRMYDMIGSLRKELIVLLYPGQNKIDIGDLKTGMYILKLQSPRGNWIGKIQIFN